METAVSFSETKTYALMKSVIEQQLNDMLNEDFILSGLTRWQLEQVLEFLTSFDFLDGEAL